MPPARGRALHDEAVFTHCDHGAGERAAQAVAISPTSADQRLVQSLQFSELDGAFVADMADGSPKEPQPKFGRKIEKHISLEDNRPVL